MTFLLLYDTAVVLTSVPSWITILTKSTISVGKLGIITLIASTVFGGSPDI